MTGDLLAIEDVLRIARIRGLTASSSGVAFQVERADLEGNRYLYELRVSRGSGAWESLSLESPGSLAVSPRGLLAFTGRPHGFKAEGKDAGERGWVFLSPPGGGWRPLAAFFRGVWLLRWAGDDTLLVGGYRKVDDGYDEDYVATSRLPLWVEGEGLVAGVEQRLYMVDAESGHVDNVELGVEGEPVAAEACGGRLYAAVATDWRRPDRHVLVELRSGSGKGEVVAEGVSIGSMKCTEKGLALAMHGLERGTVTHYKLHLLEPGGALECITCSRLDRNVVSVAGDLWGGVAFTYLDSGRSVLAIAQENGSLRDAARGDYYVHQAAATGGEAYLVVSSPTEPPELYRLPGEGRLERLTRLNEWLRGRRLARPERLVVESQGDTVEGWVLQPPDGAPSYGERRPLILFIHGGPKGMYGYQFHPEMQLFAAEGFIVAYANPRGSDGYSEDYADLKGGMGEVDYKQLIDFLDEVEKRYPVDPDRMAVTGISYGGYMTNVMTVKAGGRFKAAVSENGIADWIADYWASDIGYWWDHDYLGAPPHEDPQRYIKASPAYHAAKAETPLLIIHSMEDYRCFIDQALAMHVSMLKHGKESKLVVFKKGGHGHSVTAQPRHRRKRLELKLDWIKEKLGIKQANT